MNSNGTPKKKFIFTDSGRMEKILSQYPDKRSATLPLLHLAQTQEGFITGAIIDAVAQHTETHPAEVMDCVSFYTMFFSRPQGTNKLQVCQTLSCSLNGADDFVDHITQKYGTKPGETTSDGKFTLLKVECLGSCGTAPVIQINNDYHEGLSINELDKLLDSIP